MPVANSALFDELRNAAQTASRARCEEFITFEQYIDTKGEPLWLACHPREDEARSLTERPAA